MHEKEIMVATRTRTGLGLDWTGLDWALIGHCSYTPVKVDLVALKSKNSLGWFPKGQS